MGNKHLPGESDYCSTTKKMIKKTGRNLKYLKNHVTSDKFYLHIKNYPRSNPKLPKQIEPKSGKSPHFRGASSHLPAPQSLSLSHPGGHRLERLRPRATRVPPKIRSRVGCVSLPETKSGSLGMDGFHSKPATKTGNLMCF